MNEPVFEDSMFTDDQSYQISFRTWVCIQNATTGFNREPWLILPNYDTLRINLFWTNSQAVATDFLCETWLFSEKEKMKKSFIFSDYEVALVTAYWKVGSKGDETIKFACRW